MEILQDRAGDALVVTVAGRLDSASAGAFRDALAPLDAAREPRIVLDLGRVDYISSAGLAVLLWMAKRMRDSGRSFVLCEVGVQVRRVLELASYIQYFTIAATRDEALALM